MTKYIFAERGIVSASTQNHECISAGLPESNPELRKLPFVGLLLNSRCFFDS